MSGHGSTADVDPLDGRRDFDFLAGNWRVTNRTLRTAPGKPAEWVEFESRVESRLVLGGLGNVDTYYAPDAPGRGLYYGLALRLFDPSTGLWRIWWASTADAGRLDPPLAGLFTGGEGHFEGDDHVGGHAIKVRFKWSEITPTSARWEQSFSFDDGKSFETNWVMQFHRDESTRAEGYQPRDRQWCRSVDDDREARPRE